jgi:hypothetical protein
MLKILVPTDLKEISEYTYRLALDMAEVIDAQVYLINFLSPSSLENFSTSTDFFIKSEYEQYNFNTVLGKVNELKLKDLTKLFDNKGRTSKAEVIIDYFGEGIKEFILENQINWIFIGPTEESFEERMKEVPHFGTIKLLHPLRTLELRNVVISIESLESLRSSEARQISKFLNLINLPVVLNCKRLKREEFNNNKEYLSTNLLFSNCSFLFDDIENQVENNDIIIKIKHTSEEANQIKLKQAK